MNGSLARRTLLLLPFACVALYGCPSQEETQTPDEEYADVVYEGETTDEAMVALGSALDQAAPTSDAAHNPVLDSPASGELPKSPIAVFQWHIGATAQAPAAPSGHRLAFMSGPAGRDFNGPAAVFIGSKDDATWPAGLAQLFGPPRAASAHGSPLNGQATLLVFSTKSDAKLVRVLTDTTSYTPSQEAWDKLTGAGSEITLTLIGAEFDNNRIADGGGPFEGATTTFTIAP